MYFRTAVAACTALVLTGVSSRASAGILESMSEWSPIQMQAISIGVPTGASIGLIDLRNGWTPRHGNQTPRFKVYPSELSPELSQVFTRKNVPSEVMAGAERRFNRTTLSDSEFMACAHIGNSAGVGSGICYKVGTAVETSADGSKVISMSPNARLTYRNGLIGRYDIPDFSEADLIDYLTPLIRVTSTWASPVSPLAMAINFSRNRKIEIAPESYEYASYIPEVESPVTVSAREDGNSTRVTIRYVGRLLLPTGNPVDGTTMVARTSAALRAIAEDPAGKKRAEEYERDAKQKVVDAERIKIAAQREAEEREKAIKEAAQRREKLTLEMEEKIARGKVMFCQSVGYGYPGMLLTDIAYECDLTRTGYGWSLRDLIDRGWSVITENRSAGTGSQVIINLQIKKN